MNKPYEELEKIMCLNLLSNISSLHTGIPEFIEEKTFEDLEKILGDTAEKELIGEWEIVWGPGVFQHTYKGRPNPMMGPDNTLYVARQKGKDTYVVSVAGTAATSTYDWMVEDLDYTLTEWDKNKPGNGKIAYGIKTGLNHLKEIKPGHGRPGEGKTICEFLKEKGKVDIITTGHSLGGSLSPALALWLYDQKIGGTIKTYPSAGVTLGDPNLAKYFNQTIKNQNIFRIWNDKDVVPSMWTQFVEYIEKFKGYNSIYNKLRTLYDLFKRLTEREPYSHWKDYVHIGDSKNETKIEGVLYKGMDFDGYMVEVYYQHTLVYIEKLGLSKFGEAVQRILGVTFNATNAPHPLLGLGIQVAHVFGSL